MNDIKTDILECKILIVDDDKLGRILLREVFKQQGFTNIEEAVNGKEGLDKTRSFRPDLVLLDVIMPEMDGIECCKQIRADPDPRICNTPILFQTALDSLADKSRLFAAGATDFLSKPIDPHEITARAVVHLEQEIMTRTLRMFKRRVLSELDTARSAQRVLIPNEIAIRIAEKEHHLHIAGHFQPCSELGGDFWGFKKLSSDELAVYMVDFSGHGVSAALNVFRLHALMHSSMSKEYTPGGYLTYLNHELATMLQAGQYATMFYGIINQKTNSLSYASAAAPQPLLFNSQGSIYCMLDNAGMLLGAQPETQYQTTSIPFAAGNCLLLYSDALIENKKPDGKMLEVEDIATIFQNNLKTKLVHKSNVFESLLSHLGTSEPAELHDDLTLSCYYRAE